MEETGSSYTKFRIPGSPHGRNRPLSRLAARGADRGALDSFRCATVDDLRQRHVLPRHRRLDDRYRFPRCRRRGTRPGHQVDDHRRDVRSAGQCRPCRLAAGGDVRHHAVEGDFPGPGFEPGLLGGYFGLGSLMEAMRLGKGRRYLAPEALRGRPMRLIDGRVLDVAGGWLVRPRGRRRARRPRSAGRGFIGTPGAPRCGICASADGRGSMSAEPGATDEDP